MSRLSTSLQPATALTPYIQRQEQQDREILYEGWYLPQLASDAAQTTTLTAAALRWAAANSVDPDPEFRMTADVLRELADGLPDEQIRYISRARSMEEGYFRREQIRMLQERQERLASVPGWQGVTAQFAAAVFDPAALLAAAATGGASSVALNATRLTRAQRILFSGAAAVATEGGIEALLVAEDPTGARQPEDILWAMTFAGGLGGAFYAGSSAARRLARADKIVREDILRADMDGYGLILTDRGSGIIPDRTGERLADLQRNLGLDEVDDEAIRVTLANAVQRGDPRGFRFRPDDEQGLEALGRQFDQRRELARRTELSRRDAEGGGEGGGGGGGPRLPGDVANPDRPIDPNAMEQHGLLFDATVGTDSRAYNPLRGVLPESFVRFDSAGMTSSSKSHPLTRFTSSLLFKDGVGGRADGGYSGEAVETYVHRTRGVLKVQYEKSMAPHFERWAERQGYTSPIARARGKREFFEEIGKAKRLLDSDAVDEPGVLRGPSSQAPLTTDPDIIAAVKDSAMLTGRAGTILKLGRPPGADDFALDPRYIHRQWSEGKINKVRGDRGDASFSRWLAGAMRSQSQKNAADDVAKGVASPRSSLSPGEADVLARAMERKITRAADPKFMSSRLEARFARREELEAMLADVGVTGDEAAAIARKVFPAEPGDEGPAILRRRAQIDETWQDPDTGLQIADFLENNDEYLSNLYFHNAVSISGYQRAFDAIAHRIDPEGPRITSFDELRSRITRVAEAEGFKDMARLKSDLNRLEHGYRRVNGIPSQNIFGSETAQVVRDAESAALAVNYSIIGQVFGLAAAQEIPQGAIEIGLRDVIRQAPSIRGIIRSARTKTLSSETLDELDAWVSVQNSRLANRHMARIDPSEGQSFGAGAMGNIARGAQTASHVTADFSLMSFLTDFPRRLFLEAAINRTARMAASSRTPSARRLRSLGLNEADWEQISQNMAKHAAWERTWYGHRIRRPNLDEWDQAVAGRFVRSLNAEIGRVIQDPSVGTVPNWTTRDGGRTISQFSAFMFSALTQQNLARFYHGDVRAYTSAMVMGVSGVMTYIAQTYMNAVGRDDRDEYLRERLAWDRIAASAVQRSGLASVYPGLIDFGLDVAGFDPLFASTRYRDLQSDSLLGLIPAYDTAASALSSGPAGIQAILGRSDLTEREARDILFLIPGARAYGIRNVVNEVAGQFPDYDIQELLNEYQ